MSRYYLCALAVVGLVALCFPGSARADEADDATGVQCVLQSASLNFGRLNLQHSTTVAGEGEVRLACHNTTPVARRVKLSLAFPTLGSQSAALESGHDSLFVAMYQDALFVQRWGDDHNGAAARHIALELGPGERKHLRLPVFALLQNSGVAAAGSYLKHIPITLTTLPR